VPTYQGYIKEGYIVPLNMPYAPEGFTVTIAFPESGPGDATFGVKAEPGTIEYLFRDYDGASFQAEPADLGGPVGNEKW
jgi:hypothetical protein